MFYDPNAVVQDDLTEASVEASVIKKDTTSSSSSSKSSSKMDSVHSSKIEHEASLVHDRVDYSDDGNYLDEFEFDLDGARHDSISEEIRPEEPVRNAGKIFTAVEKHMKDRFKINLEEQGRIKAAITIQRKFREHRDGFKR